MMDKRKVFHALQNAIEYYEFSRLYGWKTINKAIGDSWQRGQYDYVELRHSMAKRSNGLYGSHINW